VKGVFVTSLAEMMQSGLRGRRPARARAFVTSGAAVLGALLAWALVAGLVERYRPFNPIFVAAPWLVLGKLIALARDGQLWTHVGATVGRVAVGFGAGAGAALVLGLLAGHIGAVRRAVEPVVELLRPIPPLAMLPLFIVWVGIGETSKIAFIAYATFFPVFLTTVHAVEQVDPLLLRAAQSLGARRGQLFLWVLLPSALPEILTGLRLGVALGFFVIVISEFIGAESGLGYLINDGRNFFLVPQMLGAAVLLGLLGWAASALLGLLGRRVLRWDRPA
jgi:ABC-type nitrate/sulfonate/bicarbonate transport system permease component